jgi:hypothetical protein
LSLNAESQKNDNSALEGSIRKLNEVADKIATANKKLTSGMKLIIYTLEEISNNSKITFESINALKKHISIYKFD